MTTATTYEEFLLGKMCVAEPSGFTMDLSRLTAWLKPHCQAIVPWALAGGRRAIFASFGLHKTSMQLEMLMQVKRETGRPVLCITQLGCRQEFFDDAHKMGLRVAFIRSASEIEPDIDVHITNYETVRGVLRRGEWVKGFCYLMAGFKLVGETKKGLYAWQLLPHQMPPARALVAA